MPFNVVLLVHYCLENDPGSNALSGEAAPRGSAPAQRRGGRRAAVQRLGSEGRALWAGARSRHPDSPVNVGVFSGKGGKATHSVWDMIFNTLNTEFYSLLLCPLFPVGHLITKLLNLAGAFV